MVSDGLVARVTCRVHCCFMWTRVVDDVSFHDSVMESEPARKMEEEESSCSEQDSPAVPRVAPALAKKKRRGARLSKRERDLKKERSLAAAQGDLGCVHGIPAPLVFGRDRRSIASPDH